MQTRSPASEEPTSEEPAAPTVWQRMPPRWALLTLLCLALVVRGRVMLSNVGSLAKDPDAYREVAWQIADKHTIGLWRDGASRVTPTATRPPLYPLVLAFFDLLPISSEPYCYGVLHVVLGVGTVWCAWRLGLSWGLPPGGALLATALVAVDPILLGQSVQLMTETLATFLAAAALVALSRAARDDSPGYAALAGALLGLSTLCRPTFLVWLVACALAFAWRAFGGRKFARACVLAGAAALTLAPWAIRNWVAFGRPVITTTHGGYTLLLANNPQYYEFLRGAPWGSTWDAKDVYRDWNLHLVMNDAGSGATFDEVAADRWAYDEAWTNIRNDPLMFAYSCLARWGRLFDILPRQISPDESPSRRGLRYAIAFWYSLELTLALVGGWFLGRRLLASPWLWGTLLVLSVAAVHALYWTDMRMRAPLAIVIALAAAQGALLLAARRPVANDLPQTT